MEIKSLNLNKSLNKEQRKGVVLGSFSPFLYSFDTVFNILLFAIVFTTSYRSGMSLPLTMFYSFLTSFIKDFSLFIFQLLRTKGKIFKNFINNFRHKGKGFWLTVVGSLFGGPLGFSLTTASVIYSGAAYGSALANFSPIIVLVASRLFLKTQITKIGWIGVGLAIFGFIGVSFSASLGLFDGSINVDAFAFNWRIFVGVILAILAVLTWSVETFVAEYVEKFKDQALDTDDKLNIKSITSSLSTPIFFIPITLLLMYTTQENLEVNYFLSNLFSSYETYLLLIGIGFVIALGRIFYWYAIDKAGGGRADVLYYLSVIITPIITLVFSTIGVIGFEDPAGIKSWIYWILIFSQLLGVILITITTINSKQKFK